jgi:hypothetical protein
MIRDAGSAPFAFALDEIKIFDGPCGNVCLFIFFLCILFLSYRISNDN